MIKSLGDVRRESEKRKKIMSKAIPIIGVIILFGSMFTMFVGNKKEDITEGNFSFYLGGEIVEQIEVCNEIWDYGNLTFIPCDYNNSKVVLMPEMFNYSLSPEGNCEIHNATFPGFNIKNETINEEFYGKILPKCYLINNTQIDAEWLTYQMCVPCYKFNKNSFECTNLYNNLNQSSNTYDCGDGLIVSKLQF